MKLIWGFDVSLWGHDAYAWGQRSVPGHVTVTFRRHDEYAWGQRLGFFVSERNEIGGHTCTRIDLWLHAD